MGTILNLWCPSTQHVQLVLHCHHHVAGQWHWQRRRASPGALLHGVLFHTVCDQILIFHFHLPSYYVEVVVGSAQCVELTELSGAQTVPKVVSSLVVSVGKSRVVNALVDPGPISLFGNVTPFNRQCLLSTMKEELSPSRRSYKIEPSVCKIKYF